MTGFGKATYQGALGRLSVEARSVNNRFLELNIRLGNALAHLETGVRAEARAKLQRGKVDIVLRFDPAESLVPPLRVQTAAVAAVEDHLRATGYLAPGNRLPIESLLGLPGVVRVDSDDETNEVLDAQILATVREALDALRADRRREGETLRASCRELHGRLAEKCAAVTGARGDVVARYRDRLLARIEELLGPRGAALDAGRLEQEVAVFADKADITEEVQRLAAHLDALADLVAKDDDAVGRPLDFLCQEILREVNTIGSKCRDLDIARDVLAMKQDVESLKEVLANIE